MNHPTTTPAERIGQIISFVLSDTGIMVRPENLRPHHILYDLGADPLDVHEIIIRAEEVFGIEIPDDAIDTTSTVGDLLALIGGQRDAA